MNRVAGQNLIPLLGNNSARKSNSSAGACRGFFQSCDTIPTKIVLSAGAMICGTFGIAAVITSALYEGFDESKTTTLALSGGIFLAGSFGILYNTSKIKSVVKENSSLKDQIETSRYSDVYLHIENSGLREEIKLYKDHLDDVRRDNLGLIRENNAFTIQFGMPASQQMNETPEVVPPAEDNA